MESDSARDNSARSQKIKWAEIQNWRAQCRLKLCGVGLRAGLHTAKSFACIYYVSPWIEREYYFFLNIYVNKCNKAQHFLLAFQWAS